MTYFWPLPPVSNYTFNGKYYEQIFDPSFHEALADHMGVTPTYEHLNSLQIGHYQAYLAFFEADIDRQNYLPEKIENRKLQSVADDAERLAKSLTDLLGFGQCHTKLVAEISNNPTCFANKSGTKLADLLDRDRTDNQFHTVIEFLSDIFMSASRATNVKPPEVVKTATVQGGDGSSWYRY